MGKQFNLEYTDKDGHRKVPAIIHRAPLGTHERFIGFLIEHYAGAFPTWLAPLQIAIVPVKETCLEKASELHKMLRDQGIRSEVCFDNDSLGKRIHKAKVLKPPYILVLGDKEIESGSYTLELRNGEKITISKDALLARLQTEIKERA
jgi:threonyl-tRNA synthetase